MEQSGIAQNLILTFQMSCHLNVSPLQLPAFDDVLCNLFGILHELYLNWTVGVIGVDECVPVWAKLIRSVDNHLF